MSVVSDANEDALCMSLFRSAFDNEPRRIEITWPRFAERLCAPPVVIPKKENAFAYSPAVFSGSRANANVERLSFLSFDLDDIEPDAFRKVCARVAGLDAIVYSTFSHSDALSRGLGRYRLVLRLSRPVLASEWQTFWSRARDIYAPDADECSDEARIYFLPCVPPGCADVHEAYALEGEPVDVDKVLAAPVTERPRETTDAWSRAVASLGSTMSPNRDDRRWRVALENEVDALALTNRGKRNDQLNIAAFNLGQIVAIGGLGESDVVYALLGACVRNGLMNDDGELAVRRTIRSGMLAGQEKPRPYRPKDDEGQAAPAAASKPQQAAAPTPADVVRAWQTQGPLVHEPTGIEWLDAATDGGPVYGTRWYIQGAPDAGKTALLIQIAHEWAERGVHIAFLAVDEEPDDIVTRLAQRRGFSRMICEARSGAALGAIALELGGLPIRIYDATWTIERVVADLVAWANGAPAALMIDSLQTAQCDIEFSARELSMPLAIKARTAAIRFAATQHRLISLTTSEMGRAAYRSKNMRDNIDPLAAGKWSGDIEYAARVLPTLRSVQGSPNLIEMELPKNKHGQGRRLASEGQAGYLALDRDTQRLIETCAPAQTVDGAGDDDSHDAKAEAMAEKLLAALVKANAKGRSVTTREDLYTLVSGDHNVKVRAVSKLKVSGRIQGGRGKSFAPAYNTEGGDE